jgi:hypothetical protein
MVINFSDYSAVLPYLKLNDWINGFIEFDKRGALQEIQKLLQRQIRNRPITIKYKLHDDEAISSVLYSLNDSFIAVSA